MHTKLALSVVVALSFLPRSEPAPLRGFTADGARAEREWETRFRAIPEPARMRAAMQRLTARPHHVGSPYDKANADWLQQEFTSYGWDTHIERFDVLFPTPKERVVELVAPTRFRAKLQEPTVPEDPTSGQHDEQLPTYNAYSIDGDVTAPMVYVNYGVPADYEELAKHGVSVKGAIVLARYGGSWRGIKPKVAAEHGAVGCLIFSDPRDDGFGGDAVFPKGPMRPRDGVQRGSVADMPVYPGDPLTPGVGATAGAKRLDIKDAQTITKIPVLPISYADAEPLLGALEGPIAPERWRGGLPITYRLGGSGPARAHLVVKSDWSLKPLYDVIAKLPGTTEADEWIIRGNHHDAWVNGAEDPISGLVVELEEARALGSLYKNGWRPKRTIIYAAWDGEEPGLLGSTEWSETHADEIRAHAVAYINSDTNDRGFLGMEGSHTLERFLNDVTREVDDPEAGVSVWKRAAAQAISGGGEARTAARAGGDLPIGALGSGSDFTPFLQHLGVASLNVGFGGEDDSGIYHSIYDDFYWYTHFSDTSFVYGRALAQVVGMGVMRLAGADLLPFRFSNLSSNVSKYVQELQKLRDTRAESIAERNRQRDEGTFAAMNDPRRPTAAPPAEVPPPQLEFAVLLNAADSLAHAASRFENAYDKWSASGSAGGAANSSRSLVSINEQLVQSERLLTSDAGLPLRTWYRHLLYAPGFYTGYDVKTMPGAREAMEQGQWQNAEREMARIAKALNDEAALVSRAAVMLGTARQAERAVPDAEERKR